MADERVRDGDADPALADTAAAGGRGSGAPRPLRAGDRLGRYTILELLGVGGMSVVYAARDPDLERNVGLKLLRAVNDSEVARARLKREARAMARLRHASVITVYEVGEIDERVFVAMELIEGLSLAEWLAAGAGANDWREVLGVFLAAGRGLAAAHAAGLVHRDFKPGNVLLDHDGRVVVTDFGLARPAQTDSSASGLAPAQPGAGALALIETWDSSGGATLEAGAGRPDGGAEPHAPATDFDPSSDNTLTRTGAILGTPAYMAPEQHRGGAVDARTDQFSFCVALYEGLYGERPFQGQTPSDVYAAILRGRVADVPRSSAVPQRLRRILLRGLRAEPGERYPSMEALLAALESVVQPRPRTLVATAALLLAGAVIHTLLSGSGPPSPDEVDCSVSLAGAWDEEVAGAVRASLAQTAEGAGVFTALSQRLDAGRARWQATRARICDGERLDSWTFHQRMGCLLDYRDQVAALTGLVRAADARAMDFAVSTADALPDPGRCALLAPVQQAERSRSWSAAQSAEAGRLRSALAQAATAQGAARFERAIELAQEALSGARRIGDRFLEASALLRLGSSQLMRGQHQAARPYVREAILIAEEEGFAEILAEALVSNASIDSTDPTVDDGQLWELIGRARVAVRRLPDPGLLQGWIALIEGYYWAEHGDMSAAEAAFVEAREGYQAAGQAVKAVRVDLHWGLILHDRGRHEEAAAKLRAGLALLYEHIDTMSYEMVCMLDLGYKAAERLERYEEARRLYDITERKCGARAPAQVDAARPFRGRVVDQAGRPVAGAEVLIRAGLWGNGRYAIDTFRRGATTVARTGQDGVFTLVRRPVERTLILVAEADDGRSFPVAVDLDAGAGAEPRVSLRVWGGVSGRLELDTATPRQRSIAFVPVTGELPYRAVVVVPVRADGWFEIERLAAGRYHASLLEAEVPSEHVLSSRWLPLRAVDVAPAQMLMLTVTPAAGAVSAPASALDVHVHNRFHGGIPRVHIMVFPGRSAPGSAAALNARVHDGATAIHFAAVTEHAPAPAVADTAHEDLWHRFEDVPGGDVTVCAVPLGEEVDVDPLLGYPEYLDVYCEIVRASERAPASALGAQAHPPVIIEAAPMRRRP